MGYDYVVGCIGNFGETTLIKVVVLVVIVIVVAHAVSEAGQTKLNRHPCHRYTR